MAFEFTLLKANIAPPYKDCLKHDKMESPGWPGDCGFERKLGAEESPHSIEHDAG